MTAKEYLSQLRKLDIKYHNRLRHIADMRADVPIFRGMSYDSARVMSSGNRSTAAEKMIDSIVDNERELQQEAEVYYTTRRKITQEIEALDDDRYIQVLILRYVESLGMHAISRQMGYSYEYVKAIHGQALLVFAEKYGLETKTLPNLTDKHSTQ